MIFSLFLRISDICCVLTPYQADILVPFSLLSNRKIIDCLSSIERTDPLRLKEIMMMIVYKHSWRLVACLSTGGPSSSCKRIILRSKSHGEIVRVCLGIFTIALRNKKYRQILNKNTSSYFHGALLAIWPLTEGDMRGSEYRNTANKIEQTASPQETLSTHRHRKIYLV